MCSVCCWLHCVMCSHTLMPLGKSLLFVLCASRRWQALSCDATSAQCKAVSFLQPEFCICRSLDTSGCMIRYNVLDQVQVGCAGVMLCYVRGQNRPVPQIGVGHALHHLQSAAEPTLWRLVSQRESLVGLSHTCCLHGTPV